MLHFPTWKISLIAIVCLLGLLFAAPNFLPTSLLSSMPSWLPSKRVNLGLDLRGGSHLLLEVDFSAYIRDQLENIEDNVRQTLRGKKIYYTGLHVKNNDKVVFTLRNATDGDAAYSLLREMSKDITVSDDNATFTVMFTDSYAKELRSRVMEQSIEIVRRRIDETGTKEPSIQRQGDNRILLQVPGLNNPEHLKQLLGKTAKMTFHLVNEQASIPAALRGQVPADSMLLMGEGSNGQEMPYIIKKKVMLSGDLLTDAKTSFNDNGLPAVSFSFNTLGAKQFADITKANTGHLFAIVLDSKVISAPVIREPILGGSGIISGNFTVESANDLALLLRAGALPAPLTIIEERTVGPSLGADSIAAGKKAALIGVVLVVVFMVLTYGLFGGFANLALILNVTFILAALSALQATLTMPGIAGIVLTMGMAVDANVLIFERIREELRIGMSPFTATDRGFDRAFATIIDSNLTTLLAAFLLYAFGSGAVKGFAVTLSIGILSSMFSAITLTRFMVAKWLQKKRPKILVI